MASRKVTEMQLLTLAFNYVNALYHKRIGKVDAVPPGRVIAQLSSVVEIPEALFESLLAYANYIDEEGQFRAPNRMVFNEFVERILTDEETFDRLFNTISKKSNHTVDRK